MDNVFVYGTLQDSQTRYHVLQHMVKAEHDVLNDYSKVPHSYFGVYPTIKEDKGKFVAGKVFKANTSDLERMDRYETENYKKINVKLVSGKKAVAYIESSTKFI